MNDKVTEMIMAGEMGDPFVAHVEAGGNLYD